LACLPAFAAVSQNFGMSIKARRIHNQRNAYAGIIATGAALLFVVAIIVGLI
jgi:hypothetical protein